MTVEPEERGEGVAQPDQAEQAPAQSGEGGAPGAPAPKAKPAKSAAREWVETVVVALAVALLIRTFVVQVYLVEGESMEPTLHTSERLFVNKLLYRVRDPKPGEIVVLQDPSQPARELIKRVVAVAGETVEVKNKVVYVNGQPLKEPFKNTMFLESVHDVDKVTVPTGYIYVMGDNRGRSFDSRAIGPIELSKVDGKAFFMFWPLDKLGHGPLDQPRQVDPTVAPTQ